MKIVLVHPNMSIMGGGERVALHSIKAMLQRGDGVTLLSESFDTEAFEDFFGCPRLFAEIRRITYPEFRPRIFPRFLVYQRILYHQAQLRKVLSRVRESDLLLSTQDVAYLLPLTGLAPAIQYCYFPEYFSHLEAHASAFWRLYYWPARKYYRRINRVDRLLSVSEFTRSFVRKIWGREATTLYPPCPVGEYAIDSEKEDMVVSVGRIVPEKRFHLFLEMARRLPSLKFIIIASVDKANYDYYRWLEATKPANTRILLSPLRKVKEVLAKAKIYVHCMNNEHFGITIVEAMAAGCVPVVHDSGGPREIVTEEVGYLWRDVPKAIDRISLLICDDETRKTMSVAARRRAEAFRPEVFEKSLSVVLSEYER